MEVLAVWRPRVGAMLFVAPGLAGLLGLRQITYGQQSAKGGLVAWPWLCCSNIASCFNASESTN